MSYAAQGRIMVALYLLTKEQPERAEKTGFTMEDISPRMERFTVADEAQARDIADMRCREDEVRVK